MQQRLPVGCGEVWLHLVPHHGTHPASCVRRGRVIGRKRRWDLKQALGGAFSTVRQTLGAAGRGARHISEHSGQHRGGISELAAAGASQSDLSANLRKITALVSAPRQPRAHTECRGHRCHHLLLAGATPRP
jgi:hypothetical protein